VAIVYGSRGGGVAIEGGSSGDMAIVGSSMSRGMANDVGVYVGDLDIVASSAEKKNQELYFKLILRLSAALPPLSTDKWTQHGGA
jgi:hypothetical protein